VAERVHRVLWFIAITLAFLLFAGGPGPDEPRSLGHVWDLGHIAAFLVWTVLWLRTGTAARMTARRRWSVALAACAALAVLTEAAQWVIGRDLSVEDGLRDMLGGLLALSWGERAAAGTRPGWRLFGRLASLVLLTAALAPFSTAVADEWMGRRSFPVLSDFETPFESGRWEGSASHVIDRSHASRGNASLRVDLVPAEYSGVELVHAPRDWRGYRRLRIEVFNPGTDELELYGRIHDGEHDRRGRSYRERYNTVFRLAPGWNALTIDLDEARRGPASRSMDMSDIRSFMLFVSRLRAPRTIFIDHVRLE